LKGTAVQLLEGDKNIEDIAPGDEIISFDPNTKEITQSTVEAPYSLTRDHYYEIVTSDGKVIKATDEHPFYVGSDLETAPISVKAVLTRGKIYFQDGLEMLSSVFVRDL
jgi:intein/homing endonuclease